MGVLVLLSIIYFIYRFLEEASWNRTYPGKFDWDECNKDGVKVSLDQLSISEYRRRMKNGYYHRVNKTETETNTNNSDNKGE